MNGVPSSSGNTKLSREEFQSRVGRRLGLVLCEEMACPLCHQTMDRFGAHAESCVCGGDFTAKHNQTNMHIYKQAKTAGTMPEMEKAKLLAGGSIPNLGRRRPADTLLNSAAGIKTGKQRNRLRCWRCQPSSTVSCSGCCQGSLRSGYILHATKTKPSTDRCVMR